MKNKAKLLQVRELLVAYSEQEGFQFTEKQLKKKKLARIEEAFETITVLAYKTTPEKVIDAFQILRDYDLTDDHYNCISYNETSLKVKLTLTDLGKRVTTLLYGTTILPPLDRAVTFSEYEAGYTVIKY